MAVKKQRAQCPCTALLRDGSRCGRYYKVGDSEPFCSVHRKDYTPKGAAVTRPKPVTHEERLRRFAESSDPRVSMQAIGILERRRAGEDGSIDRSEQTKLFIEALTENEHERLRSLVAQYRELQRDVYMHPEAPPRGVCLPR